MNEEIPYAIYVKNETKELTGSIELTELPLPVSIEIVPHKAILVHDGAVVVVGRGHNYIHFESKWCFFTFCSIPFMISIIMVVGILNPRLFNI
jgi:uncharacterized protein YpmS